MTTARSCSIAVLYRAGEAFPLPRYGTETGSWWPGRRPSERCHDCGVQPRAYHHIGCDMAQCPLCGGQMLSCGCCVDEDDDDPDEARSEDGDDDADDDGI